MKVEVWVTQMRIELDIKLERVPVKKILEGGRGGAISGKPDTRSGCGIHEIEYELYEKVPRDCVIQVLEHSNP